MGASPLDGTPHFQWIGSDNAHIELVVLGKSYVPRDFDRKLLQ